MSLGILGKKVGMTNTYNEKGEFTPVTLIEAGPCYIAQIKTAEKDKYNSVQLTFDKKREKIFTKAQLGHFKKLGVPPCKFTKEFRLTDQEVKDLKAGQEIKASALFKAGDTVNAVGTSKGKGYQGVMKRHNFSGAPAGHGTHEFFRHGGSIGGRFPQHTVKGRKMAGHMGSEKTTVRNLKVVEIIDDKNLLVVKGSIPGANNSYVIIEKVN